MAPPQSGGPSLQQAAHNVVTLEAGGPGEGRMFAVSQKGVAAGIQDCRAAIRLTGTPFGLLAPSSRVIAFVGPLSSSSGAFMVTRSLASIVENVRVASESPRNSRTAGATGSPIAIRVLVVALGIGMTGAGIAAVFLDRGNAGAAALIILGSVLVLIAALGEQLDSLRYGDLEVVLRRRAVEAEGRGDPETAAVLQNAADRIGSRISATARSYASLRTTLARGQARTEKMEEVLAEARQEARTSDLKQDDVLTAFWTGSEGARVWALGVLEEHPEMATTRVVLDAVERPDHAFDHYHALLLAQKWLELPTIDRRSRERVVTAVREQIRIGAIQVDGDRYELAQRILAVADSGLSS